MLFTTIQKKRQMILINLGKNIIKKPRTTHPPAHIDYSQLKWYRSLVKYRKYLVKEYRRANVYTMPDCQSIIERVFKIIGDKLVEHEEVDISDFGKFRPRNLYLNNWTVHFYPCARLQAAFNPENKLLLYNALKDRKVMTLDFEDAIPKEEKPKFRRNRKKVMVDAKDVDIKKIVEKLEKAQYRSWRKR